MIGQIEQLAEKIAAMITSLKDERDSLKTQCDELRARLAEKELECIRLSKENLRSVEIMDRERLSFQKEKARAEEQIKALYERLSSLLSDGARQAAGRPPKGEGRG